MDMPLELETDILNLDDEINPEITESVQDNENANTAILAEDDELLEKNNQEEHEEEDAELSPDGILDEETIARGLSNVGRSANGDSQVFLNVTIPGFSLTDISLLGEYIHLQKVEIPYNDITDLSPLGKLKNLLILDASHNKIEKVLDFEPPFNLQEVNLSWNKIKEINNLSSHHSLRKLCLDNNEITSINGLQHCKRLKHLSLSHNKILKIQRLDDLPIQYLNLSYNGIRVIEKLESMKQLRELNLSGNCIRSLSGLDKIKNLEIVNLEDNEVIDIVEINHIKQAKGLCDLNLLRNPIQELPDYRLSIIFRLNKLTLLDRKHVKDEEKVAAVNTFDPPMEVVAARDHIMHVVYSFLQPAKVWNCTLPNIETPYPMLVLVGPQGSGKKDLAMKLVDEFSDYFGYGVSHTTRKPRYDEMQGRDYYFVSLDRFESDIKTGQFIQTYQYNDHWYGLQMESIENVARDGLACIVHMELEGVLTLKKTYFEPRYVLVMPLNTEIHEKRLRKRDIYTEEQIKRTLKKSELYVKTNQDHPGFFDIMICSDDITEAYKQLRKIVMDYLGITSDALQNVDPNFATREATPNNMRGRTWSKPSNTDSSNKRSQPNQSGVVKDKGIVEQESFKRRQSAAKNVFTGYVPPLYDQIKNMYPKTAPQSVKKQVGFGELSRATSEPAHQRQPPNLFDDAILPESPDSSCGDTVSSGSSDLDSATELQQSRMEDITTLYESMQPKDPIYMSGDDASPCSFNYSKYEPHSFSPRPGSDRHAVLPPIQNTAG